MTSAWPRGRDDIRNLVTRNLVGGRSWYQIRNLDPDEEDDETTAEILIYDEISLWGVTAEDFANDLAGLDVANIVCRINCRGGDVWDGIAIYNALRDHPANVTTQVDGMAASAASFVAQAGDRRTMMRHAQMMIHNAQGIAIGDSATMREMAELLDKQNEVIAGIYAERSTRPRANAKFYMRLMASETWMTDAEAVDNGLADEVRTKRDGDGGKRAGAARVAPAAPKPDEDDDDGEPDRDGDAPDMHTQRDQPDDADIDWHGLFSADLEDLLS